MTVRDIDLFALAFRRNPKHAKSLFALFVLQKSKSEKAAPAQTQIDHVIYCQTYRLEFETSRSDPRYFTEYLKARFADYSPAMLDSFDKRQGEPWCMQAQDEFNIRVVGPWIGRVRAREVEETEFVLQVLKGHHDAGHLRFRVSELSKGCLCLEVESWADSPEGLEQLTYVAQVKPSRSRQPLWQVFCERTVQDFGGRLLRATQVRSKALAKFPTR